MNIINEWNALTDTQQAELANRAARRAAQIARNYGAEITADELWGETWMGIADRMNVDYITKHNKQREQPLTLQQIAFRAAHAAAEVWKYDRDKRGSNVSLEDFTGADNCDVERCVINMTAINDYLNELIEILFAEIFLAERFRNIRKRGIVLNIFPDILEVCIGHKIARDTQKGDLDLQSCILDSLFERVVEILRHHIEIEVFDCFLEIAGADGINVDAFGVAEPIKVGRLEIRKELYGVFDGVGIGAPPLVVFGFEQTVDRGGLLIDFAGYETDALGFRAKLVDQRLLDLNQFGALIVSVLLAQVALSCRVSIGFSTRSSRYRARVCFRCLSSSITY